MQGTNFPLRAIALRSKFAPDGGRYAFLFMLKGEKK